jgi:guanosine-3',5'-bis(diphosphate) 3'-pyrophosphohydrolase
MGQLNLFDELNETPSPPMLSGLVARAQAFATQIHAGQLRRDGQPYVTHCAAVAAQLTDELDQVCGWLHDCIEDGPVGTAQRILEEFCEEVYNVVEADTRRDGETYAQYIQRVKLNPRATRVKIADLKHNLIPNDYNVAQQRYRSALRALEG